MTKAEMITKMARLVAKTLFAEDAEVEANLANLEAQAEKLFPREHKQIAAAALNLALGHKG